MPEVGPSDVVISWDKEVIDTCIENSALLGLLLTSLPITVLIDCTVVVGCMLLVKNDAKLGGFPTGDDVMCVSRFSMEPSVPVDNVSVDDGVDKRCVDMSPAEPPTVSMSSEGETSLGVGLISSCADD